MTKFDPPDRREAVTAGRRDSAMCFVPDGHMTEVFASNALKRKR